MIAMPVQRHPPRDQHGLFEAQCNEFADELGFKRREIWQQFKELACIREFEQRIPRALAEHLAMEDVRVLFDKRGEGSPC